MVCHLHSFSDTQNIPLSQHIAKGYVLYPKISCDIDPQEVFIVQVDQNLKT